MARAIAAYVSVAVSLVAVIATFDAYESYLQALGGWCGTGRVAAFSQLLSVPGLLAVAIGGWLYARKVRLGACIARSACLVAISTWSAAFGIIAFVV